MFLNFQRNHKKIIIIEANKHKILFIQVDR